MPDPPQQTVVSQADGAGDATSFTKHIPGRLALIRYDGGHGATATLTITTESGETLWSEAVAAAKTVRPAVVVHDENGAPLAQRGYAWLFGERVQIVVSGADPDSVGLFVVGWAQ